MNKVHITLLGKETLPIYYLVKKENYDEIYILATEQNPSVAERLRDVLHEENIACNIVVVSAFDIIDVIKKCESIHDSLDSESMVTYNLTGGNKLMAIGAYRVAIERHANIVYTNSSSIIDLTTFKTTPLDVPVDSLKIFALQGQELKEYTEYVKDISKLESSQRIMRFISKESRLYQRLRKQYENKKMQNIPLKEFSDNGTASYTTDYEYKDGHICVWKNEKLVLDIEHQECMQLLFEGRWWETLVADSISKWAAGRFEIWQNVKFWPRDPNSKELDKNEIDILVNTGNKLLFIECKSGNVTQDNINKMSVIRQNYGSEKSMSVLISYYHLRAGLQEKAKEANLNIITGLSYIHSSLDNILTTIKA